MLFSNWSFEVSMPIAAEIMPDGCRDLIIVSRNGRVEQVLFSDWDWQPREVTLLPGQQFCGFRFRPGLLPDLAELEAIRACCLDKNEVLQDARVSSLLLPDWEILQIIDALALEGKSVKAVAAQAGVSERTLQRRFAVKGLPAPEYWRQLGRARRAALALTRCQSLSAISADSGYSDQAHMTRDFSRWFGMTPRRLQQAPDRLALLAHSGLGNWTEEQISTR
ncbi:helix-turn-helix domain-containing protein [Bowmanella yangjiangensis]|uniref:AraC family transcriptional regulator n=1 Tax=Bowmanella yangjiangensis TaxID=2811230 RepID=A0ABS3CWR2_9ALTE|nr:AraC family transcriptional regulator [Bowmanella yangjiangensis]MBN7821572.1 AraC family transcriptional regulator [Bowmanella yangjiangensis]